MKCKLCGTEEPVRLYEKDICEDCWKHLDCQCGLEKLD
jgi:hypothetical protein